MRSYFRLQTFFALIVLASAAVMAQTQKVSISQPLRELPDSVLQHINQVTAEVDNADGAESIMKVLLQDKKAAAPTPINPDKFKDKNFYCIFHVLRWSKPADDKTQTIQSQNWYLYNRHKLTMGDAKTTPRLFGAKQITLLYIHLNKHAANNYEPLYRIEIVKKTPAYISHLLGLAGLYNTATAAELKTKAVTGNWWAADTFDLDYRVSDITVTPKLTRQETTAAVEDMGAVQKFDNEGKYFIDFSVGVPVKKFSELNFDSTNNTVTAKEVNKTTILALVNLYARPIDIRSSEANLIPHFVGGVAMEKQPLHKIFVGGGFGPVVANFYVGALFVKQQQLSTLKPGDAASPAQLNSNLSRRYKAQFAFGINLPVGAVIEKLKGK